MGREVNHSHVLLLIFHMSGLLGTISFLTEQKVLKQSQELYIRKLSK